MQIHTQNTVPFNRPGNASRTSAAYFTTQTMTWPVWILMIGAITFVVGTNTPNVFAIVAGILLFLIGAIAFMRLRRVTDEEYDRWVEEQRQQLYEEGLALNGLTEMDLIQQVFCVQGYVLPGTRLARDYAQQQVRMRRGRDGKHRTSINVFTFFFATQYALVVFSSEVNAFKPTEHIYAQHEIYRYKDVITVTTESEDDTVKFGERELPYRLERLYITLSNGSAKKLGAIVKATLRDTTPQQGSRFRTTRR